MILGVIEGKVTTSSFSFLAKEETRNFEYVQVYHRVYDFVLCQVVEVVNSSDKTVVLCQVIGYKDKNGLVKLPRIPFDVGSEVLFAEDDFIQSVINLPTSLDSGEFAVIGQLEGRSIPVAIDLNKLLTKHVAVLAKSGAGKSYTVGVLLEEIIERGVPLLIIDPHGEYSSMAFENKEESELALMASFGVSPKAYNVAEYADTSLHPSARPLRLTTNLSSQELTHLFPGKLTANQQAILYSALKNLKSINFDSLLSELELEESPAKFNLINTLEYLRGLPFFSAAPTPYSEFIKSGQASIINLRGIPPDIQEIIVYKITKDLFSLRKQNKVSPFFMVVEEAHNFCPERSFGETKASKVLRDVASEGRKFGLGLCVVSQRPARVDKSVLSQCSTQIILKVTNPNDLKAISNSVEGITSESEKEIRNLPIGSALLTGVTEVPLFVKIRPRKTSHGGRAVNILGGDVSSDDSSNLLDNVKDFSNSEVLPLIKPSVSPQDLVLMADSDDVSVSTFLIPAYQFVCKDGEDTFKLLVDMTSGNIVTDKDNFVSKKLPDLDKLNKREMLILQMLFKHSKLPVDKLSSLVGGSLNIADELTPLVNNGYVDLSDGVVVLSDNYIFSRLHKVATFDEIVYESLKYDVKKNPVVNLDDIKILLGKFTSVEDYFDCFLVSYSLSSVGVVGGSS